MADIKTAFNKMSFTIAAICTLMFFAACAKSDKSGQEGVDLSCPNCQIVPGQVLVEALVVRTDSSQSIEMGLTLLSVNQVTPVQTYAGPVQAEGYIRVSSYSPSTCSILPAGDYIIRSIRANGDFNPPTHLAVWNLTHFQFEVVNKANGYLARVQVNYANFENRETVIGSDGLQYGHSMFGEIRVVPQNYTPNCPLVNQTIFFPKAS